MLRVVGLMMPLILMEKKMAYKIFEVVLIVLFGASFGILFFGALFGVLW